MDKGSRKFWGVAVIVLLAGIAVGIKIVKNAAPEPRNPPTEAAVTLSEEELFEKAKEHLPEAATIEMLREMERRLKSKVPAKQAAVPSPEQAAIAQHLQELPQLIQKAEAGLEKIDQSYSQGIRPLVRKKREEMIGAMLPSVVAKTKVKMQESLTKITAEQYPAEAQAGIKVLIAVLDEMANQ